MRSSVFRTFLAATAVLSLASVAAAQVHVDGYQRKDGTYVAPYNRTSPDGTKTNNYGYPGNYNPNTGKITPQPSYGNNNGLGSTYGNTRQGGLLGGDKDE